MKILYLYSIICIGVLIFASCGDGIAPVGGEVLPKIDTFDCPKAEFLPDGQGPKHPPGISHKLQRRSPDGSKIAYIVNEKRIKILHLKTGILETYDPSTMMPTNTTFIGCYDIRWCPYDDNKLCCMFVTGIDTTGKQGFGVYGQNLFILYRKESKFEMVDLPFCSKTGHDGLFIYGWLRGSTKSIDSLFLLYGTSSFYVSGIIILQEKKIVPIAEFDKIGAYGFLKDFLFSPEHQHSATLVNQLNSPPYGNNIFIDGIPLR
ncbi:MAG: hypothetical protein HYZ54_07410, partial [Ignavibacteriae bacterium]|nr:hypothetical protein [Ignavibacteriota bacterium]